jgi:hypothetical protein
VFLNLWSAAVRSSFGRKSTVNIVSETERMKNTPTHVCPKLPLLVDLEQKAGELFLSTTSCNSIIILENTLN